MEWYRSSNSNSVKPADVDDTSSKVYVYVRKDFELIPEMEENDQVIPEHWEYMEKKISKEIYPEYAQNRADIDYIAFMTDVDLEV